MNMQRRNAVLKRQLKVAEAEAEKWKTAALRYRSRAQFLSKQLLYLCLKWLRYNELQKKHGWRFGLPLQWRNFTKKSLPENREELRQNMEEIKQELELP